MIGVTSETEVLGLATSLAFLVAYGLPSFFWVSSLYFSDDPKYKRLFADTYLWLPAIFWFVYLSFVALFGEDYANDSLVSRVGVFLSFAFLEAIYFKIIRALIYNSLISYAEQTTKKPAETLPVPDDSELYILILKP